MFLEKDVLKICSKFTGENPCQSVISIKLQSMIGKRISIISSDEQEIDNAKESFRKEWFYSENNVYKTN